MAEGRRSFDLSTSEIEGWGNDAKRGMENSLRANPLNIREQYEKLLKDLQEAYGEAMLDLRAREVPGPAGWVGSGHGCATGSILCFQQGLLAETIKVPLTRLCAWFGGRTGRCITGPPRRRLRSNPHCAEPVKAMIERKPSVGYRTVARLPDFNKNRGRSCSFSSRACQSSGKRSPDRFLTLLIF